MGFFKSVTSKGGVGTIAGGLAGAFLPGGNLTTGLIGAGFGGALFADDPQVEALRAAGMVEEAAALRAQKFQEFILQETAAQREAGRAAIGQLQSEVTAPIGSSPLFQRGLIEGQRAIAQQTRPLLGLGSSAEAIRQGTLQANLLTGEIGQRRSILGGLAGQANAGLGTGLGALQLQSGLAGRQAQTLAGIGGTQAAGQQALFGNLLQAGLASMLFGQRQLPEPTGGFLGSGGGLSPTQGFIIPGVR